MNKSNRIFVAGHNGLVGSAIVKSLNAQGYERVLTAPRSELDLLSQAQVQEWFAANRPDVVILAAAKVGGIHANATHPADFIHDNLSIQNNVIHTAFGNNVQKLVFLGSSCIYPRDTAQPIVEESLLTGSLEPTNEWYAIAKIAGLKMCQAYRLQYGFDAISLMPTNLYGPNDNFDLKTSHVLPALIRKVHEAKTTKQAEVEIWGTGKPRREFLHVDDLANAVVFLMERYSDLSPINVGVGDDVSIHELADLIKSVVGFDGGLTFDYSKPDGTPRKVLNVQKLTELGWQPKVPLRAGIQATYEWFLENKDSLQ